MAQEKLPVRLLKCKKVKGEKVYNNLYVQLGEGSPIAIDLVHFNPKIKALLLANATDVEVSRVLMVRQHDENGEVLENVTASVTKGK